LFINTEKTKYILFKKPHRNIVENVISYQGHEIKRVNCAKFLGLYLEENLHWNEHINFVIKKISPVIRMMSRQQNVLTENAKKCLYYGLIQSHLLYMIVIYGTATNSRLEPIYILQNRAIKMLYKINPRTLTDDVYSQTGFLNFTKLGIFSTAVFGYSVVNGYWLSQTRFIINTEIHKYTRQANQLHSQQIYSSKYGIQGVYNNICQIYNSLPDEVVDSQTPYHFKRKLKEWLRNG